MTRLIYVLAITIIVSCNSSINKNQKPTSQSADTQKIAALTDNSTNINLTADSIDKANENTIILAKDNVNKAMVSLKASLLWISNDKFHDHRIFGYSKPDIHSKKMI